MQIPLISRTTRVNISLNKNENNVKLLEFAVASLFESADLTGSTWYVRGTSCAGSFWTQQLLPSEAGEAITLPWLISDMFTRKPGPLTVTINGSKGDTVFAPFIINGIVVNDIQEGGNLPSPDYFNSIVTQANEALKEMREISIHPYRVDPVNGEIIEWNPETGEYDIHTGYFAPAGPPGPPGEDGEPGVAATLTIERTDTLPPGQTASVENVGDGSAAKLVFGIPQGLPGAGDVSSVQGSQFISADNTTDPANPAVSLNGQPFSYYEYAETDDAVTLTNARGSNFVVFTATSQVEPGKVIEVNGTAVTPMQGGKAATQTLWRSGETVFCWVGAGNTINFKQGGGSADTINIWNGAVGSAPPAENDGLFVETEHGLQTLHYSADYYGPGEVDPGNAQPVKAGDIYAFAVGDKIYLNSQTETWVYDTRILSWKSLASLTDYTTYGAWANDGKKLYICAGTPTGLSANVNNLFRIFDIETNTWSRGTNLPVTFQGGWAAVWNNFLYVSPGTTAVYKIDLANTAGSWQTVSALTGVGTFATYAQNGKDLYILAGVALYLLDLETETYSNLGNVSGQYNNQSHGGMAYYDGMLYGCGGGVGGGTSSFVRPYSIDPDTRVAVYTPQIDPYITPARRDRPIFCNGSLYYLSSTTTAMPRWIKEMPGQTAFADGDVVLVYGPGGKIARLRRTPKEDQVMLVRRVWQIQSNEWTELQAQTNIDGEGWEKI